MDSHFQNCERDPCACDLKRYWLVLLVAAIILVLEVVGGIWSGSLALLSDAGHVFVDKLAILVAIYVEYAALKKLGVEERLRRGGAYIKACLLFLVACWVAREAYERLQEPTEIIPVIMLIVAAVGALGNYVQYLLLNPQKENLTKKGMRLHVLSDLWQSLGVITAGILVWLTNKPIIDVIVSAALAFYMFFASIRMFSAIFKSKSP